MILNTEFFNRIDPFFALTISVSHCLNLPLACDFWSKRNGKLVSIDRGAHPSLIAYFNQTTETKNTYNEGEPVDDWDTYLKPWSAVLAHIGQYGAKDAEKALRTVLPDVLKHNRSAPAAFPNGRTLTDNVTSARLRMISNGKI